jgi:hypothetical protein
MTETPISFLPALNGQDSADSSVEDSKLDAIRSGVELCFGTFLLLDTALNVAAGLTHVCVLRPSARTDDQ